MKKRICYWCKWYGRKSKYKDSLCELTMQSTSSNDTCQEFNPCLYYKSQIAHPLPLVQGGGR